MPREKEHFRELYPMVREFFDGKEFIGVYDIMAYTKTGYNAAKKVLGGRKKITVAQFTSKLL